MGIVASSRDTKIIRTSDIYLNSIYELLFLMILVAPLVYHNNSNVVIVQPRDTDP